MHLSAVHPRNENLGLYNVDAIVSKDCCINPTISRIFDNMLIFHRIYTTQAYVAKSNDAFRMR